MVEGELIWMISAMTAINTDTIFILMKMENFNVNAHNVLTIHTEMMKIKEGE